MPREHVFELPTLLLDRDGGEQVDPIRDAELRLRDGCRERGEGCLPHGALDLLLLTCFPLGVALRGALGLPPQELVTGGVERGRNDPKSRTSRAPGDEEESRDGKGRSMCESSLIQPQSHTTRRRQWCVKWGFPNPLSIENVSRKT